MKISSFFKITLNLYFLVLILNGPFQSTAQDYKVLVFTKTTGFRHESIPSGINAIKTLGGAHGFSVSATENASVFTSDSLGTFRTVIFLSTTGDILDSLQQIGMQNYIHGGGGFVGIHAASDTEYSWAWYGRLVGAFFKSHPAIQPAVVSVADHAHPSTQHLPYFWNRTDEWYNYSGNPRGNVHVLATLDEKSYTGGEMGNDHPIAWCHEFEGGKSWYTGGGHTTESYADPLFLQHLLGGIEYASGKATGKFDATLSNNFELTILDAQPKDPIAVEVLPDLSVLYIERAGGIKIISQPSGTVTEAGKLQVTNTNEDGMLGLTLDPDFSTNKYIYISYSPAGNIAKQHVSRFRLENNRVDLSSEKVLLEIPTQREQCCHSGGALEFDSKGNLYISVGDNTNPFNSSDFAPIDERPGREYWDAQRTAANTQDLRGKILRIKPAGDGTYSIPEGNLFKDAREGRPEIFVMGTRNPYRIAIDTSNDFLYWGDVGPDARADNPLRGPKGYDEFNRTNAPGNFGWPYCIADNQSYRDYDFASDTSGHFFNCDAPINNSINNTGNKNLPVARPAWIWYPYDNSTEFPELGFGQRTAMAGGVYHFDPANTSEIKLPSYFDKKAFLYEWSRSKFYEVTMDDNGKVVKINNLFDSLQFKMPIDMTFGPDGAIYIVQWGSAFWGGNPDSRILKIGFIQGGRSPVALINSDQQSGQTPLEVKFSSKGSYDPDKENTTLYYSWDVDGDGISEASGPEFTYVFNKPGIYNVSLTVKDNTGKTSFAYQKITAGNTAPDVAIRWPLKGGFFDFGESIQFGVSVADAEDGKTDTKEINCNNITVSPIIGHDEHGHNTLEYNRCVGEFTTTPHGEGTENVFYILNAAYEDMGKSTGLPLSTSVQTVLRPKRQFFRYANSIEGGTILKDTAGQDGPFLGQIASSGKVTFDPVNLHNISFITFRAGATAKGTSVIVRKDSVSGPPIASRIIDSTGSRNNLFSVEIPPKENSSPLFLEFRNTAVNSGRFYWMDMFGRGVAKQELDPLQGLLATYNSASSTVKRRKEPLVAFDWGTGKPGLAITADDFDARWEGLLTFPVSGNYTLQTIHKNGSVKLYVNDSLVIEKTADGTYNTLPVAGIRGQQKKIRLEYLHSTNVALIYLQWKTPSTDFNVIPTTFLHLPETTLPLDCNGDIDGTAFLDSCGTCTGGLTGFPPTLNESNCILGNENNAYSVVNNPMTVIQNKQEVYIQSNATEGSYYLMNSSGQKIANGYFHLGQTLLTLPPLPTGIFMIQLIGDNGRVSSAKIILE